MTPVLRPAGIGEASVQVPSGPDGRDGVPTAGNVRADPRDTGRSNVTGGSDGGPPVGLLLSVVVLPGRSVRDRRRE